MVIPPIVRLLKQGFEDGSTILPGIHNTIFPVKTIRIKTIIAIIPQRIDLRR